MIQINRRRGGSGGGSARSFLKKVVNSGVDLLINYNINNAAGIGAAFTDVEIDEANGFFTTTNNTQIEVTYDGYCEISFFVTHTSTGQRASLEAVITQNGAIASPEANGYIRRANGANQDGIGYSVVLSCVVGDVFEINLKRQPGATNGNAITILPRSFFMVATYE